MSGLLAVALLAATVTRASAAAPRYPVASSATVAGLRIVSETDGDALLSGVQIFVSAGLARQTTATNGAAALTAECVMRTPAEMAGTSVPLRDAVAGSGGGITYTVDESSVHYYLEARPERMLMMLGMLAKALAQPDFSATAVAAARSALVQRVTESEKNPLRVGVQMFKESFLQAGTAFPEYGTAASLSVLGPSSLREFYSRTYRRGALSASAAGLVTPEVTAAIGALAQALPEGSVPPIVAHARSLSANPAHIVTQRDVGRPFVVVGFGAPAPGSRDFGAMLLLEALLSNTFERGSSTTIALGQRSVGAFYLYDSAPASLVVFVNGGTGVDPSLALRDVVLIAKSLAEKPMGADALRRFKAAAEGAFVTNATSLSDRSFLLGMLSAQGLGDRSINGALEAIEGTTSADVQRTAKTYLQRYVVALVLPRQSQS
jgi:predicted Zn-dependent peptidase